MRLLAAIPILLLATPTPADGELSCPAIFSDHMVLQRDQPVSIWGEADPGADVTVQFDSLNARTTAAADGRWHVTLAPLNASAHGHVLEIHSGNEVLRYVDVLVGEVWLASGQSNMEKPFGPRKGQKPTDDSDAEIAAADAPRVRLYQVPHYGKPKSGVDGLHWLPCSPESLTGTQFSAAAYVFARELERELDVPVGIIHASFGGTQIEAWIPPFAWDDQPALAGVRDVRYPAWVEGVQASELYASMIAPLVPYTLRGFLWYQGEANVMNGDGAIYTEKMRALISGWRQAWQAADAPFYYALLAPFNYSEWTTFPKRQTPESLPIFWEAQVAALEIPHTGLIVTTDLVANVRDIHPTNKRDVGERFARLALGDTYAHRAGEFQSPRFSGLRQLSGDRIELQFEHTGGALRTRDGGPVTHLEIAGADGRYVAADADIAGDRLVVFSSRVRDPVSVRFAWHETAMPNLINAAGLPAVPFRLRGDTDIPVCAGRTSQAGMPVSLVQQYSQNSSCFSPALTGFTRM